MIKLSIQLGNTVENVNEKVIQGGCGQNPGSKGG